MKNLCFAVLVMLMLIGCDDPQPPAPPNVLFIMVDDLNDWVGYLGGHPQVLTPNIDRLAQRGVAFLNAHTNAPLCGPSRASMLTGIRPSSSGIYFHIRDEDLREHVAANSITTLPAYFRQKGYKTLGVGKIFHNGGGAGAFDEYGGLSNFGPRPEKRFKYDPEWFGKPRGTSTDWGAYPEHDTLTFDHRIANWAIDQLSKDYQSPFLLAAGFMRPHVPWYVPRQWFEPFPLEGVQTPPYDSADWSDLPEVAAQMTHWPMMPEMEWMLQEGRWQEAVQAYLASVHFVDHQIGRVLDALKESRHADNTVIVLASDHGYHVGEKGLFQKGTLWRRSTHIPMIWAGPDVDPKVTQEPASLIDIYPTLLDLCWGEASQQLEGASLVPVLMGDVETIGNTAVVTFGPGNHAVYDREWHLIQYDDGSPELYHLQDDPGEWTNLAENEKQADVLEDLIRALPPEDAANMPLSRFGAAPYFNR